MLQVTVNGEKKELPAKLSLAQALPHLGFEGNYFAVALDGAFIPRSEYAMRELQGGEALEILAPRQGG